MDLPSPSDPGRRTERERGECPPPPQGVAQPPPGRNGWRTPPRRLLGLTASRHGAGRALPESAGQGMYACRVDFVIDINTRPTTCVLGGVLQVAATRANLHSRSQGRPRPASIMVPP